MSAFAVAHLGEVRFGPEIIEYLERIDATLAPFDGAFRIHDGDKQVLEGRWPGALIVVEFPDRASALAWYESSAYQAILPLRTRNAEGCVIVIDGVPDGYLASSKIRQLADAQAAAGRSQRQ